MGFYKMPERQPRFDLGGTLATDGVFAFAALHDIDLAQFSANSAMRLSATKCAHSFGFRGKFLHIPALRHSLTSGLANLDVAEEIRRRIVGHESADVHKIFTHHEIETLARAVEKLPSV